MQRVLVTGASRGLGLELCAQALEAGDRVWATCRDPAGAPELMGLKERFPESLVVQRLDVCDAHSIQAARCALQLQETGLDLLINNAGIADPAESLGAFDAAVTLHTLDVNALGPVRVTQEFVELLARGESPRVINVSSQLGSLLAMQRDWGRHGYNASKAALNMFTRKLAHELKPLGIIVVALHPGWVRTDMGGAEATLSAPDSVRGILRLARILTLNDTNRFFTWSGEEHPW